MTKVLPESDNAELAGLNPAHVGDHIAHGRSHSGARRPSCGDDWANIHAGSVRQLLPAIEPVSKSTGDLMNKLASIVFAAGLALLTTGAQAMPLAAIDASNGAVIIQVAQGCGPGGHRGPFGHCRPLYDCRPGWHTGPYGVHCFRNQPPVISG
jgi:hypothetical protein